MMHSFFDNLMSTYPGWACTGGISIRYSQSVCACYTRLSVHNTAYMGWLQLSMPVYLYVTLSVHARVVSLCVCLFVTLGIHARDDYGSVCVCVCHPLYACMGWLCGNQFVCMSVCHSWCAYMGYG